MEFCERGVWYEQKSILDDQRKKSFFYHPAEYLWLHLPSGKNGVSEVGCRKEEDLDTLIGHWNRTNTWLYCRKRPSLVRAVRSSLENLPLVLARFPDDEEVIKIVERRLTTEEQ